MKIRRGSAVFPSVALLILAAGSAFGLVIEREDAGIHFDAPADDPGWVNVGVCNGWTAVYLGRGWVLTAAHVGASNIELDGITYKADIKSREHVLNADGTPTDLMVFRIDPEPNLPSLEMSSESPPIGSTIVMAGSGFGRGKQTTVGGRIGFLWDEPSVKRWGTSIVREHLHDQSIGNTDSFATRFSIARTEYEAHAAHGDSGGAAFAKLDGRWQLAGIILAVDSHTGQQHRSAVYGNRTFIADLARYRDTIDRITADPSD